MTVCYTTIPLNKIFIMYETIYNYVPIMALYEIADKFKFCCETVEFAGLKITPNGIALTDKILTAIKDFPKPQNITDACSWFGLVNQVAWE